MDGEVRDGEDGHNGEDGEDGKDGEARDDWVERGKEGRKEVGKGNSYEAN